MDVAGKKTKAILRFYFRLFINIGIVFLLFELLSFSYGFAYKVFANIPYKAYDTRMVAVTIREHEPSKEIAVSLKNKDVIENEYIFLLRMRFSKYNGMAKPGTYQVGPAMSTDEILGIISAEEKEE